MVLKSYHISPTKKGNWIVRKGGATRATRNFSSKTEAINFGRKLTVSNKGDLIVHKSDGSILTYSSYSISPYKKKKII